MVNGMDMPVLIISIVTQRLTASGVSATIQFSQGELIWI